MLFRTTYQYYNIEDKNDDLYFIPINYFNSFT